MFFRQRKRGMDSDFSEDESKFAGPRHVRTGTNYRAIVLILLAFGSIALTAIWLARRNSRSEFFKPPAEFLQKPNPRPIISQSLKFASPTRVCTADEAALQGKYSAVARVRGCPSEDDAWLRFAQTVLPNAKVFVDIGSNKGYTAARFFELWSPELGLNSKLLHQALKKVTTEKDLLECGACSDCLEVGQAIVATSRRFCSTKAGESTNQNLARGLSKAITELCAERAKNFRPIKIYSFDGNPVMVDGVKKARDWLAENDSGVSKLKDVEGIPEERLPNSPKKQSLQSHWSLELGAFSDSYEPGKTVEFVLGEGETGHLIERGKESTTTSDNSEQHAIVPVLTVDHFVEREGLGHIDILKIDTEGHDPMVLKGAKQTITEGKATLIVFEYNNVWSMDDKLETIVNETFEPNQYACYLEGKNLLLKLNYGCWSSSLEMRQWSNVWCISLRRPDGIGLSSIFDSYALAFV